MKFLIKIAAALLLASSGLFAQSAPIETPIFVTLPKDDRMDARLFPLGWSADGKFAWITREVEEAAVDGIWTLSVLDTKTNKVVEEIEISEQIPEEDEAWRNEKSITKFWAAKKAEVLAKLKKHGVKFGPTTMDHLPLVLGERRRHIINPKLTVTKGEITFGEGVIGMKLTLDSGETESVILEQKVEPGENIYAMAMAGCFHSPDEKFGAIIVTSVSRGFEGAQYPRDIHSVVGFRLQEP